MAIVFYGHIMKMRFSILIPVYNAEKYLYECVNSVLKQTYEDYEIIIVDDGSSDSSIAICDEYAECYKNIRVFHQENKGPLLARRVCASYATGDYCFYLDADDFLEENALKKLEEIINKCDPDVILISSYKYFEGKIGVHKKPIGATDIFIPVDDKRIIYEKLLQRDLSNTLWSKVFKRSLFDYNEDYSCFQECNMGEDLLQSLSIINRAKTFYYMRDVIYYYRTTSGSLTQKYNDRIYTSLIMVNKVLDEYVAEWNMVGLEELAAYRYLIDMYDVLNTFFKSGDINAIKNFVTELGNNEYFQRKYTVADKARLNIRQKYLLSCVYKKYTVLVLLYMKLMRPLIFKIQKLKMRRIPGDKLKMFINKV